MIGEIKDFFGLDMGSTHSFIDKVSQIVLNFGTLNIGDVIVGVITLLIIIFMPKLNKKIPASFVAIVVVTIGVVISQSIAGNSLTITTIGSTYGEIKAEFNFINFTGVTLPIWYDLIKPVLIITFLCAIESLLSAKIADSMTNTASNPNQELVGQGVATICSSLLGGLPATGAIARTAANIRSNAHSPLAGMFHAVFLLIIYLLLMPVVAYIPLASLAAVLVMVAVNMSNFKLFVKLTKFSVTDSLVLMATCLLTIFFDLSYGVLGRLALKFLLIIPYFKKPLKMEIVKIADM